jgi:cobalamin biosynthesis Mg chelatase CobN
MDCVACGKPISVTAKFCGKCGAPVKRSTKPVEALASTEAIAQPLAEPTTDMGVETLAEVMSAPVTEAIAEQVTEQVNEQLAEVSPVDELTFTLSPPDHMTNMRDIDLNLPQQSTAQISMEADKLKLLEQTQSEIKKTLEKHSLLLDFISLTSQQQSHQQTQPDPLEPLVSQVAEQQTSLQSQLTQLAALLSQNEAQQHSQRMPEEFKLQLEKQKIEIHKLMAQSLAQNNENLKDDQHEVIEHLEKRIEAYHQAAQQSLEKNMGALASGMSELKTQLQAVQKKAAEKSVSKSASSGADSDGGSFMIFVIGLLCGLTVVLSSVAIYNCLSPEPPKADKHDGADTHEAAPADKHDAPPAEKPH